MGDRGNIVVRQSPNTTKDDVWFYTHWSGCSLAEIVQAALKRKQRWDDPNYLARIIFCELVKPDPDGETGFGISTSLADNEYPILIVDVVNQTVQFIEEGQLIGGRLPRMIPGNTSRKSFEDFCKDPLPVNAE